MKNTIGKDGEKIAIQFLKDKSFEIIATNWRFGRYEIDIIAKENNVLVIVEVKTRQSDIFGHPSNFVKNPKQQNIYRATEAFVDQSNYSGEIRFDILAVYFENGKWQIDHIEDAFYPN